MKGVPFTLVLEGWALGVAHSVGKAPGCRGTGSCEQGGGHLSFGLTGMLSFSYWLVTE